MANPMDIKLEKIDDCRWRIPRTGIMRVPGLVFANPVLLEEIRHDQSLTQVANVAALPGIVGQSLAMPDVHWGYGFPIGGVAAFDAEEGIVSPGGVGYDINCGCRLMTTRIKAADVASGIRDLTLSLYRELPTGVGSTGGIHLSRKEIRRVAEKGAAWAVNQGFGGPDDLERTENRGVLNGADPDVLSDRAVQRGLNQLGTLGSGNHFLEIQVVDRIYDNEAAQAFHLFEGQLTLFLHTGSRGFGHQICDDFLKEMVKAGPGPGQDLPDRQLACAGLRSDTGRRYLAAMSCAANYAWANRQVLMSRAVEVMQETLGTAPGDLGAALLYDVCHNIAKMETHDLSGKTVSLCVHRKGATRSLPPGHPEVPGVYRRVGQPVLIPGDMGTFSFVLTGGPHALEYAFGSSCHGAGRVLSRSQAVKRAKGRAIHRELEDRGVFVQCRGKRTLKEEMPEAYKDITQVVDTVHSAGLAGKVARLRPLGVIKG
jgi:tRNA-splicing ligase RtcB